MREALPNAFLFGLTGTPINRADRNSFFAFGAGEDEKRYMSRYGFEESIRDGATLKLHFEPRLVELHSPRRIPRSSNRLNRSRHVRILRGILGWVVHALACSVSCAALARRPSSLTPAR
jgi:type I site-specific restriction-modification system R (restriction) subunit